MTKKERQYIRGKYRTLFLNSSTYRDALKFRTSTFANSLKVGATLYAFNIPASSNKLHKVTLSEEVTHGVWSGVLTVDNDSTIPHRHDAIIFSSGNLIVYNYTQDKETILRWMSQAQFNAAAYRLLRTTYAQIHRPTQPGLPHRLTLSRLVYDAHVPYANIMWNTKDLIDKFLDANLVINTMLGWVETLASSIERYVDDKISKKQYFPVPHNFSTFYGTGAHLSTIDDTLLAYYPTNRHIKERRAQRIKPGKYLRKYFPHMTDDEVRIMANRVTAGCSLKIWTHAEDMIRQYLTMSDEGIVSSCMSKKVGNSSTTWKMHPLWAYHESDVVLITLETVDGLPIARCLANKHTKEYPIIYGQWERMEPILRKAGYTHGSLAGAKINKIMTSRKTAVMPYIDDHRGHSREFVRAAYVLEHPDHFEVLSRHSAEDGIIANNYAGGVITARINHTSNSSTCLSCNSTINQLHFEHVHEGLGFSGQFCNYCIELYGIVLIHRGEARGYALRPVYHGIEGGALENFINNAVSPELLTSADTRIRAARGHRRIYYSSQEEAERSGYCQAITGYTETSYIGVTTALVPPDSCIQTTNQLSSTPFVYSGSSLVDEGFIVEDGIRHGSYLGLLPRHYALEILFYHPDTGTLSITLTPGAMSLTDLAATQSERPQIIPQKTWDFLRPRLTAPNDHLFLAA